MTDRVRYCEALVRRAAWPFDGDVGYCTNRAKYERFGHPVCGVHWRATFPQLKKRRGRPSHA